MQASSFSFPLFFYLAVFLDWLYFLTAAEIRFIMSILPSELRWFKCMMSWLYDKRAVL
jgi:hypothetical protein